MFRSLERIVTKKITPSKFYTRFPFMSGLVLVFTETRINLKSSGETEHVKAKAG